MEAKKLALIRILQILEEHTDYNHPMTQEEIHKRLLNDYGIEIERKAVSRNLSMLKEAGYDIESDRSRGSYLASRTFEDSELHMLIDGVLSSRYVAAGQSKDLIQRICGLSNKYFRSHVEYIHSVEDWGKTDNQALFYNIEVIDSAIANNHRIRCDYNKYGVDRKLHKSSFQLVSPYRMILHNQRYYLMAFSEHWGNMVFLRLDRITNIMETEERRTPITKVPGYEKGINTKELASTKPYMYTDKPEHIEFLADIGIVDQVVDWFGPGIRISKTDDEKAVRVSLSASPNAMEHWAMQYLNYVEVIEPESLRERIKEGLNKGIKKYK